jgi:carboxypeptidase Q
MSRRLAVGALGSVALVVLLAAQGAPGWIDPYRATAQQIIAESQRTDFAWQRLAEVTDRFGPRLSGSEALEKAIDWAVAEMKKDGLDNVHKEPVMVPKWVRGKESLELIEPIRQSPADAGDSATPSARRRAGSKAMS